MGGLYEFITSNVFAPAGALTHTLLDNYLRTTLQYGSKNKALIVSPIVAQHISGYLKTAWIAGGNPVGARAHKWGAVVDGVISGTFGTELPVIVKQDWGTFATAGYGGIFFIVDLDNVRLRPLRGRNTMLLRNRQANDADEVTHEYRTETSMEVKLEKSHGFGYGVTAVT